MLTIATIAVLYYLTLSTWRDYLAIMHLREARDAGQLTGASKFFGYQVLFIGLLRDVLVNMIVGTIAFAEFPHEWLFTARCERWLRSETWRGRLARFFCSQYLDPFQIGGHCH